MSILRPLVFSVIFAVSTGAHTSPIIFFGEDINSSDNPSTPQDDPIRLLSMPNSTSAQSAFLSNLIGVTTEQFEGFSDGDNPTTLTFGSDTATLIGGPTIKTVTSGTFNGTYPISGDNFLFHFGPAGSFRIDFSSPQAAFGFFATDVGDGGAQLILDLVLSSGGTETINVPHTTGSPTVITSGSVFFFGLIDTSNTFTSISFTNTNASQDGFGFDDMTIGRPENVAISEPSSIILLIAGVVGVFTVARRSRNRISIKPA